MKIKIVLIFFCSTFLLCCKNYKKKEISICDDLFQIYLPIDLSIDTTQVFLSDIGESQVYVDRTFQTSISYECFYEINIDCLKLMEFQIEKIKKKSHDLVIVERKLLKNDKGYYFTYNYKSSKLFKGLVLFINKESMNLDLEIFSDRYNDSEFREFVNAIIQPLRVRVE